MGMQMNRFFQLASADLVVPHQEAWGLLADFTTLREIANTLPGNGSLQNKAITVANAIMNEFDETDKTSIGRARKIAEEVFGKNWEEKAEGIYNEGTRKAQVWGIGYCHIDTAWSVNHSVLCIFMLNYLRIGYGLTASLSKRSLAHGLLK